MASNKNKREVRFYLNDDDYKAFGHYRILYTAGGKKIVNRQRLTYLVSGLIIAGLFSIFHVDPNFTKLAYAVAAIVGIGGVIFGEKMVLRQQDKAIDAAKNSVERVHPAENIIRFDDDVFVTIADEDEQIFTYKDIQQIDMTDDAIYVWMSDTMIMPVPLHAFKGRKAMEDMYNWINERVDANDGKTEQ